MRVIVMLYSMLICCTALGFSKQIEDFVRLELEANVRNDPMKRPHVLRTLYHFEIPLSILETFEYEPLSQDIKASFIFTKGGQRYVRWIVNPEDTKYEKELSSWLRSKGYSYKKHEYFEGYLTASRSLMVLDPMVGKYFSVKVSTNHTGGAWQNKGVNKVQVEKAVAVTRYLERIQEKVSSPNFRTLPEPIGWVLDRSGIEQGMVIRSYDRFNPENRYIPGFSVIHEDFGPSLVPADKSSHKYWKKHYGGALGTVMADFIAMTGLSYKSAHSQQFIVELDASNRPTGRIFLRDFNDTMAVRPLLKHSQPGRQLLNIWLSKYTENRLYVRFGIFHSSKLRGNLYPGWVQGNSVNLPTGRFFIKKQVENPDQVKGRIEWKNLYYRNFEDRFASITGIAHDEMKKSQKILGGVNTHVAHRYSVTSSIFSSNPSRLWYPHAMTMRCLQLTESSQDYASHDCRRVIKNFKNKIHNH